jgi:hypothetical protein
MLSAALAYAARGWSVFPCGRDKRPLTAHGFKDASMDADTIKAWWRCWPDAGIGIPTGTPSGFIVLDVDIAHGGTESLEALEHQYGQLPVTLEAITGSGGGHKFFQARGRDVRNSAGQVACGLDIRGTGGYIIAPPSLHPSGRRYAWKDYGTPIADMPPWLEQLLVKRSKNATPRQAGNNGKIPVGKRRRVALSLAGAMRRKGADEATIYAALVAANVNNEQPLPEEELRALARDVDLRYAPAEITIGSRREDASNALAAPAEFDRVHDMPESVLSGRLGEICSKRLGDLPRAYAWPSLLAVGSPFLDEQRDGVRTNLYVALVGPVHSGKSQAIDRSVSALGLEEPQLLELFAGSAEQLVRKCADAAGNPRLLNPDEMGHLLKKSQIERSSFPFVLNRAYYKDKFEVLMGQKQRATFDCRLSIVGGLVEELFQDLFGKETVGGLYDRFLFGLCPGRFTYNFKPLDSIREKFQIKPVLVDAGVYEAKADYETKHLEMNPRVLETCIRTAVVSAAFDGNKILTGMQLGPAITLAEYEMRIREILKPNPGETVEGRAAHKIIMELKHYGGRFVSRRRVLRDTHAYDLGPAVVDRVISVLKANGEIEVTKPDRQTLMRWISDEEPEPEGTET